MTLTDFNQLSNSDAEKLLTECCGSSKWVSALLDKRPYKDLTDLMKLSNDIWYQVCQEADWLEAFTHHPKIGDVKSLTEKYASTLHHTGKEQAGVESATNDIIEKLANANQEYEFRFGFIFIVCATGKTAAEMLRLLEDRLKNSKEEELHIAMGEQQKISLLRLKKSISNADWPSQFISQITTHVLDTSLGKPGIDLTIQLQQYKGSKWQTIAQGVTNTDGRIPDLLPASQILPAGNYKMVFDTASYFNRLQIKGFYPCVEIQFTTFDGSHYHVPLLINPYGYSTYRGS